MSAPDTNLEKQVVRHRGALWGIGAAVLFAALLFVGFFFGVVGGGTEPQGAQTQIDGRTGAVEQAN